MKLTDRGSYANARTRLLFLGKSLVQRQRFCPYCLTLQPRRVARKYGVIRIMYCANCGLCFTSPIYRSSRPDCLYDCRYEGQGLTTQTPNDPELTRLVRAGFRGSDKDARDRLPQIKEAAPGLRMLEIGSSWGYFLHQAAEAGFDVTGVETGEARRRFGETKLGVRIVPSSDAVATASVDVVYTAHTLEHFTDLSGIFKEIARVLRAGGLLLIEVPNFDYPRSFRDRISIIGAVHPLGFSSSFFRNNLLGEGFELEGIFEAWDDYPRNPVADSARDVIIVAARRTNSVCAP